MRKGIFIGIFLPIFFLSACNAKMVGNNKKPVLLFSSKGYTATDNGEIVEFEIKREEKGLTEIKIIAPEYAKGLCFKKSLDDMTVEYNGLFIRNQNLYLPKDSFIHETINMFNYLENKAQLELISSENAVSSNRCASGNFEIDVYDSSGFIKEMRMPKNNLVVTFSDQKTLD